MGKTRFVLRTDKGGDKFPIHLVYSHKQHRAVYTVPDILLPESAWVAKKEQKVIPVKRKIDTGEAQDMNDKLAGLRSQIRDIEKDLKNYTASQVIARLKDIKNPIEAGEAPRRPDIYLVDYMDTYISDHRETHQPGSLVVYGTLKNHLIEFEKTQGSKIAFADINHDFFIAFRKYLLTVPKINRFEVKSGLGNITVAKQLSTIKTAIRYAKGKNKNIVMNFDLQDFKVTRDNDLEVIALNQTEFEKLRIFEFKDEVHSQVRDAFIFGVASGMRFSDMWKLTRDNIKEDKIEIVVKKTGKLLTIPLNSVSKAILKKHKGFWKPFPMMTNQAMNRNLHELGEKAKLNRTINITRKYGSKSIDYVEPLYKRLTVHVARKTFATLSLAKGMSPQVVMAIGGWKDYKSFKRYIHVDEDVKQVSMKKAWK
jgi:integrase